MTSETLRLPGYENKKRRTNWTSKLRFPRCLGRRTNVAQFLCSATPGAPSTAENRTTLE